MLFGLVPRDAHAAPWSRVLPATLGAARRADGRLIAVIHNRDGHRLGGDCCCPCPPGAVVHPDR